MNCTKCNYQAKAGEKFCFKCGSPVGTAAAQPACPNCSANVIEGGRFCGECGFSLAVPQPEETEVLLAQAQAPSAPPVPAFTLAPLQEAPPQMPRPDEISEMMEAEAASRKKRRLLIPILCAVLVVVLGVGGFFLLQSGILPFGGQDVEEMDESAAAAGYVTTPEPEQALTPEPITANVGDIIEFGGYDWRVLDVQGGRALLLSEYVIDHRPYHNTREAVTWEHSDMRNWLNNEFFNSFSAADKTQIAQTRVVNTVDGAAGSNDTYDMIFLLSLEEVINYFGGSGQYDDNRIARNLDNIPSQWWLRSLGDHESFASFVSSDGGFGLFIGDIVIFDPEGGVRPALWLYLSSDPEMISAAPASDTQELPEPQRRDFTEQEIIDHVSFALLDYYWNYLMAINEQNPALMTNVTPEQAQDLEERIFGVNAGYIFELTHIIIDLDSLSTHQLGDQLITVFYAEFAFSFRPRAGGALSHGANIQLINMIYDWDTEEWLVSFSMIEQGVTLSPNQFRVW